MVRAGRELLILQTTPGTVITGVARRRGGTPMTDEMKTNHAQVGSAAAVAGSYGILSKSYAGHSILPGAPFAPLAGVGVVT